MQWNISFCTTLGIDIANESGQGTDAVLTPTIIFCKNTISMSVSMSYMV